MPAPEALNQLVERFRRNLSSYTSAAYNEEQTRAEFIGPFFDLPILGWDIANRQGYAELYKDVVSEGALKVKSGKVPSGFPDYTFRIGGTRKFFVEAKKPMVDIADDAEAAYQLRRYAWSANLPLSILTNFKELAVYDCRFKPKHTDKASAARVNYLTFEEYASHWTEVSDIFSKQAILLGSFDRYAEASKGKRGTTEVDEEFLKEIEKWRELLARSLATNNKSVGAFELNFAVQRTIDRLIFLRMGEDRGIEEYEQLKQIAEKPRIYRHLIELFEQADQKYNSGIFHFNKETNRAEPEDTLTPSLHFDDEALSEIISNLYYPKSPYAFSVLGIDILGQVYERFLGKVIRLTEGHHARVEEKPEVRKAGGVYYTPSSIVQYIVANTIGNICKNKSPAEISDLRILDPACGSGSFLIAAYTLLLDYHLAWYIKSGIERYQKEVYTGDDNLYHLTTREKKRILVNHVFGVDKDSQAVEVTKLNLLLKVLEGERTESLELQQKLFKERALPDLGRNIVWGNSLIDPTFYQQADLFSAQTEIPIGFDWKREFPSVFKEGGFSAIIGNPPYLKIEELPERERDYFKKNFAKTYMKRYDAYGIFVEKSITLLKEGGLFGMIIPSTMLNNLTFTNLRKYLLDNTNITQIVNLGGKVFKNVNNDTLILFFRRERSPKYATETYEVPKYGGGLAAIQRTGTIDLVANCHAPS
ncbi:MAG: N-6 DNA methylase, partial [Nitrososphaerales archaeon]